MTEPQEARALQVSVTDDELVVDLADGRTVVVPLAWYPSRPWNAPGAQSVAPDRSRREHPLARSRRGHQCRLASCGPTFRRKPAIVEAVAGRSRSGSAQQAPAADAEAACTRLIRGIAFPKNPASRTGRLYVFFSRAQERPAERYAADETRFRRF